MNVQQNSLKCPFLCPSQILTMSWLLVDGFFALTVFVSLATAEGKIICRSNVVSVSSAVKKTTSDLSLPQTI